MRSRLRYQGRRPSISAEIEIFEYKRAPPIRQDSLEVFLSLSKWRRLYRLKKTPPNYNRSDEGIRVPATQGIYWRLWVSCFAAIPGETAITPLALNATFNADSKLGAPTPP